MQVARLSFTATFPRLGVPRSVCLLDDERGKAALTLLPSAEQLGLSSHLRHVAVVRVTGNNSYVTFSPWPALHQCKINKAS